MASKLCSTEALTRIWAIEVLACSRKLNISDLIDLVRWTPELSDDIGKNARELVSLRILETLFDQGNQNKHNSVLCEKIEFDLSNSCEDVLRHILQEMSASNFKLGDSEMLKWDFQSFVACKRNGLPMIALQKLKDAILEGNHSIFASLKERSGVVARSRCSGSIPGDGVNPNGAVQTLEVRSKVTQFVLPTQNSSPNTTENGVNELQEKHPDRNSLPSKRNRTDFPAENLERETQNGQIMQVTSYVPYAESAKKFKQDIHVSSRAAIEKSIVSARNGELANSPERAVQYNNREGHNLENDLEIGGMEMEHTESPHDAGNQCADKKFKQYVDNTEHATVLKPITSAGDRLSANLSERIVEQNGRERCNLQKEAGIGGKEMKHTGSTHDDGNWSASIKMLTKCSDVVDAGDRNCQVQTPIHDNIEVNRPREVQGQSNYADKANGGMKEFEEKDNSVNEAINSSCCNLQENTSTGPQANGVDDHNQDLETASDSDEYHDERNNIASRKNAFLSSQCTYSEDSLATQPNLCMKCNSGGQLLSCSSSTCPVTVHERCLGSAAEFDGDGKFYCPFCAYSRAISEYLKIKRKTSLARKDLATFIGLSTRTDRSKQSQVRGVDELNENNESNTDRDPSNEVDHSHSVPNVEDKLQTEPSISLAGNCVPCGEVPADLTHGELNTSEKGNLAEEGRDQECQSPIQSGEQQIEIESPRKSDGETSSHKQTDVIHRNEKEIVTRGRKKVIRPPKSSLPSEPPCQTSSEGSEEDDQKSLASPYSSRSRRTEPRYTYPALPQLRRKRQPWMKVEEDKLKEGVQKFSSPHELSIPWKAILEFGADIFQKGRTTVDLKDKWRNICKAASRSK